MVQSVRPSEPVEAAARRRGGSARASEAEVLELVERAARLAEGFALLEAAPLECAAVLLGADPRQVDRVRTALADPPLRDDARLAFTRALARRPPPPAPAPNRGPPLDAGALLDAAAARPGGLCLLLSASLEAAAVLFGVHPDLVQRARVLAVRRGMPLHDPDAHARGQRP
jgi:hypothetical protein